VLKLKLFFLGSYLDTHLSKIKPDGSIQTLTATPHWGGDDQAAAAEG
jgi:hypothetical protein